MFLSLLWSFCNFQNQQNNIKSDLASTSTIKLPIHYFLQSESLFKSLVNELKNIPYDVEKIQQFMSNVNSSDKSNDEALESIISTDAEVQAANICHSNLSRITTDEHSDLSFTFNIINSLSDNEYLGTCAVLNKFGCKVLDKNSEVKPQYIVDLSQKLNMQSDDSTSKMEYNQITYSSINCLDSCSEIHWRFLPKSFNTAIPRVVQESTMSVDTEVDNENKQSDDIIVILNLLIYVHI